MTDPIGRLITWVSLLLAPRCTHRKRPAHFSAVSAGPTRPHTTPLPAHRSPYSLDSEAVLDGTTTRSVRPYLTAHEQRQRRRELAMAALGLDMPGPYWIHGMEVA
ncbi:hypothetical protein OG426_24270 [Streptomyces canus]|uniref:hypothetical protein n=1 Tax=Streptomyces canus TaxID=58343 RepID=UPI00386E1975|nr:hypothetical protein OG426_24270 [Streptomyces canus]